MARSVLNRFVNGARQVMALQLIIAVGAVALGGWTLGLTNDLLRERERLRTRVVQLEETLVSNDIVVPSTANVVESSTPQRTRNAYPPSAPQAAAQGAPIGDGAFNPGQVIGDLFTPPPPMRVVVVHVRGEAEARIAAPIVQELAQAGDVRFVLAQMAARDPRASGYSYFDGRQSSAAAALVQRFQDSARRNDVAPWSAQLRGVALPAQGEYSADRLDIVAPALSGAQLQRLDPTPPVVAPPAPVNR